jgi:hypothetical protein
LRINSRIIIGVVSVTIIRTLYVIGSSIGSTVFNAIIVKPAKLYTEDRNPVADASKPLVSLDTTAYILVS